MADTLQKSYGVGVVHPRQIEEVEERRKRTLRDRYGAENPFSRESSLFEKVQASLVGKRPVLRGSDNPFSWKVTKEKIRATLLEKFGVENPAHNPEVRMRTKQTNLDKYGAEEVLSSPIVREKIAATNLERYGGPAPGCSPGVVEKARQTNLERWGVDWTCQHPEVRQKQVETQKISRPTPNKLECRFGALNPELLFTGDGSFWQWLPDLGKRKNPDFILPGPDPLCPKVGVTKVIEVFGDFWHSTSFTGKPKLEHESELVLAFERVGLECMVVWESEINSDPNGTRARVLSFIGYLSGVQVA